MRGDVNHLRPVCNVWSLGITAYTVPEKVGRTELFHLTNLPCKFYLLLVAKKPKITPAVQDYIRQVASMGGKARAAQHDKATLREWGKKGGRPPKKKGKRG